MRMVGLDIGDVRIGIAVCDEREIIASGVETYRRTGDLDQDCAYIPDRVRELSAERVVLGLPINMNGTQGPACEKVRAFGEALSIRCPVVQDLSLIHIFIKADNRASIRVAEAIGMTKEKEFIIRYFAGDMLHYLFGIHRS